MNNKNAAAEIIIATDYTCAVSVIGQIQLASRHPANQGPSQKIAERFARQLQESAAKIHPEMDALLEKGWNAKFDVTP